MKQIFDWLREQMRERIKAYQTLDVTETAVDVAIKETERFIEYINEAETKWEAEVCEWFKYDFRTIAPRNHDVENPYWRIPENMDKLKYCPFCGKPIKISEVE